jgi:hypothetical protein
MRRVWTLCNIQGDLGRKVNIFGRDTIGHCEKKAYGRVRALCNIQGDSGRKVNMLGSDTIGLCEKK